MKSAAIVLGVLVLVVGVVFGVAEAQDQLEVKRQKPGSIIGGDTKRETLNTAQDSFVGMFRSVADIITEDEVQQAIPISGTVSDFYVRMSAAPGAGKSYTLTIRNDGANTSVGCVVAGAATKCSDTTNSAALEPGGLISLRATPAGGPAASRVRWTAKFTP